MIEALSFNEAFQNIIKTLRRQSWFWLAVIGTALVLSQTLTFGFGWDHGYVGYSGWLIVQGR